MRDPGNQVGKGVTCVDDVHLKKSRLNFSCMSFVVRVNLLHP